MLLSGFLEVLFNYNIHEGTLYIIIFILEGRDQGVWIFIMAKFVLRNEYAHANL